jgi:hypothetical protein
VGLKAVFDESGIHDGSSICVIAGYVGSLNEWRRFDSSWQDHAKAPGFHAKRFFARDKAGQSVPPYVGWDNARRRDYLARLLDAVGSLKLHPVGALVDVRAFRGYTEDERRFITGGHASVAGKWVHSGAPTKPYYLAFWKAVMSALERPAPDGWKMEFVFDQQHVLAPLALRLYARLKNELGQPHSSRMGSATFESRDVAIGLQAADLLAHCWYQFGLYGHRASNEVHIVLSEQKSDTIVAFTREMMDKLVGRREATPGLTYTYDSLTDSFRAEQR